MSFEGFMSSQLFSGQHTNQQHEWLAQKPSKSSRIKATDTMAADCQRAMSPPQVNLTSPFPPRRMNMTLRRGHLTKNSFNKIMTCELPSPLNNRTRQMHPSMNNTPGVLDFTTFLSTDLKILVMGDSVGMQISQALEEMLGAIPKNRKVYRYSWKISEGLHVTAPIQGGGVVAGW
jgi:hypothetical protein